MDDMLLFANQKATLWQWKEAIETRLTHFRLTIHPRTHPRPVTEGIPFLGFITFPQHRRLKTRKGIYYQRKLRKLVHAYSMGTLTEEQLNASINGWTNHVRYGNTIGLRKAILGFIK